MDSLSRIHSPRARIDTLRPGKSGVGRRADGEGDDPTSFEQQLERDPEGDSPPSGAESDKRHRQGLQLERPIVRKLPSEGEFHIDVIA